jgi:hypothetical protein
MFVLFLSPSHLTQPLKLVNSRLSFRCNGLGRSQSLIASLLLPSRLIQTVTHIMEKTYSIYAATEGTWKVSSVEDRFCRVRTFLSFLPSNHDFHSTDPLYTLRFDSTLLSQDSLA